MSKLLAAAAALTLVITAAGLNGSARSGAPATGDVYTAIRTNDLARLKALVSTRADANVKDEGGETPLTYAASAGSLEAMKYLLDTGADVNARNTFGTTALIGSATDLAKARLLVERGADVNLAPQTGRSALFVAAMSTPSADIVRFLASRGANMKARDAFQNTMLSAAAIGDDVETVRIALEAGVDPNAAGVTGLAPLISASYNGNLAVVSLLLAKGAKPNVVAQTPLMFPGESPKSGPLALGSVTPLLAATAAGSYGVVKALLDAGADVNAKDGRNMTALMVAVATNHQDRALIGLLLERGADVAVKSNVGETAADWARKLGGAAALDALKIDRRAPAASEPVPAPATTVKAAAERALALLETSSQKFFDGSGCVSCHHQSITDMAAAESRAHGLKVNADAIVARMKMLQSAPPAPLLLERMDISVPEIFASALTGLAALGQTPNRVTDLLAANIAATQAADGSWHVAGGIGDRPPAEEGFITRTALCIRALKVYGPPGRAPEMTDRVARARRWLESAAPLTAEERNMKLLGLMWAGADADARKPLAAQILSAQRPDGGWRQIEALPSDAYATGQSLYALAKAGGLAATDPAYQRGVRFLLSTQSDTGAWRVTSRSPKFQAYFNSGFPYAGDQWISAWATGWATMALAQAATTVP